MPSLSTQCSAESTHEASTSNGLRSGSRCAEQKSKRSLHAKRPTQSASAADETCTDGNDSDDSNDSVFSSGSSSIDLAIDDRQQHVNGVEIRDLYLGGSCLLRTSWRRDIAIPMLKQRAISFHMPTLHESITVTVPLAAGAAATSDTATNGMPSDFDVACGAAQIPVKRNKKSRRDEPLGATLSTDTDLAALNVVRKPMFNPALLESSRVLLFVITNETRSLAPMTLAAHYIGLGYNVVLCVQMLPEFCVIGNDRVSASVFVFIKSKRLVNRSFY